MKGQNITGWQIVKIMEGEKMKKLISYGILKKGNGKVKYNVRFLELVKSTKGLPTVLRVTRIQALWGKGTFKDISKAIEKIDRYL